MIGLDGVRFGYGSDDDVLAGVDLELDPGLTLLLGPNGCGKTTLLKVAAGVEMPSHGRVFIDGLDLWTDEVGARRRLAYVPEHPDLTPYATVGEILDLVRALRGESLGVVSEALEWVGLGDLAGRTVRELSKGQRRRALLAAARIGRTEVLLLDEPFDGIDRRLRGEIVSWIAELRARGATVVVVSHQFDVVAHLGDRAVTVRDGLCHVVDPLPAPGPDRDAILEELSR